MTQHAFAAALIALAQGKKIQARKKVVWVSWISQRFFSAEDWKALCEEDSRYEFRPLPVTIVVNGFVVPAPAEDPLKVGTTYFVPSPVDKDFVLRALWADCKVDKIRLERGLVHPVKAYDRSDGEARFEAASAATRC